MQFSRNSVTLVLSNGATIGLLGPRRLAGTFINRHDAPRKRREAQHLLPY